MPSFEEAIQGQRQVVAAQHERSASYINLIMAAGYAGFFGLWQLTDGLVGRVGAAAAALLVLTSLVVFVGHEIYKMIVTSQATDRVNSALDEALRNQDRMAAQRRLQELAIVEQMVGLSHHRVWKLCTFVSVVTGFLGAGVLGFALAREIFRNLAAGVAG